MSCLHGKDQTTFAYHMLEIWVFVFAFNSPLVFHGNHLFGSQSVMENMNISKMISELLCIS